MRGVIVLHISALERDIALEKSRQRLAVRFDAGFSEDLPSGNAVIVHGQIAGYLVE
jgi:hypothetical protein